MTVTLTSLQAILAEQVALEREKRNLAAREKEINARKRELTEEALKLMLDSDQLVTSMRVDGMTVYVQEKVFARAGEGGMDQLCDALEADENWSALVKRTVHHGQLTSFAKEFADEFGEIRLPPELEDKIAISRFHDLGFREAS